LKTTILSAVVLAFALSAASQGPPVLFPQPLSPRNANYAIEVKLDAAKHLLVGKERITWRNITEEPASDAWFHLYLNAFANDQSVFIKESGGRLRGDQFDKKHWGFCRVTSIELVTPGGALDLKRLFPGEDRTVMRVELPQAVPPGGEAVFEVTFESQLPKVFARSGYAGDFNMAGQWFPKLGVFQGARGWNCHEYHANSEFFSDFGVYDVRVTVPSNYVVGATGVMWREAKDGAEKTVDFHAEDVHDFAWTASPDFIDFSDSWEGVKIRILMQPGNRDSIPRYDAAVKTALECFAKWIWKYPYQQITVVDPPLNGMGAGGMEYPTLITGFASPFIPKALLIPEMTVVHEFGHQYWYGMEANNEFEEAWLDEGINSYYESRIMDHWFGQTHSILNDFHGWSLGDVEMQRIQYMGIPDMDPIVKESWKYYSNASYGVNSYSKPTLMLKTLEDLLGREKMDEVMRAFFTEVKFTHPTTRDFLRIASQAAGRDLEPILGPILYGTSTVDFRVARVRSVLRDEPRGLNLTLDPPKPYDDQPAKASAKAGKDKGASASDKKERAAKTERKRIYDSKVVIERKGDLVLPVDVVVTFKDGTTKTEHWDGEGRYVTWTYDTDKVTRVVIDPDCKVPLDLQRLNNGWMLDEEGRPAGSLVTRTRVLFQGFCTLLLNLL
jgi:hypothetical protein